VKESTNNPIGSKVLIENENQCRKVLNKENKEMEQLWLIQSQDVSSFGGEILMFPYNTSIDIRHGYNRTQVDMTNLEN